MGMKRYHYQVTVDLADQDEDLKNLVPGIIRGRFDGTAVKVVFVGGPLEDPDDPEGGVSEPAGSGPNSPAPGEAGVPGVRCRCPHGKHPIALAGDDPRDLWPNILRIEPNEFFKARS